MKLRLTIALAAIFCCGSVPAAKLRWDGVPTAELAKRVVVLANSSDPDSLRIAQHYAKARAVPPENIISLSMPLAESITWREFIAQVWEPLMVRLHKDDWIDAIPADLTDEAGRRRYIVHGHRIAALVVCRGVPLRIAHEPALEAPALPYTTRAEFRTNAAAVDAELALLASPNHPINAFVPNPLFQNLRPTRFEQTRVVKISRLDGPTVEDALGLVDRAVAAERHGLQGTAYVDLSDRDAIGNGWLEEAERELGALGFPTIVDRAPSTFPVNTCLDAPVFYFGWYTEHMDGPFAAPGFRFPTGAIALHIHSYSATTLRSATTGWTGPLVARGVTATMGNVNEPYLQWTHRPDLFVKALGSGANLVDAAHYALRALSWQQVLIGDPLYRPFPARPERSAGSQSR